VVTGYADLSMPRNPGSLSGEATVELGCLGEQVVVRVRGAPNLDDTYSEPHGGGWLSF
jgi:hypothetical protein